MNIDLLDSEIQVLRDAVESGIYDTRGIVGDTVLQLEIIAKELRKELKD